MERGVIDIRVVASLLDGQEALEVMTLGPTVQDDIGEHVVVALAIFDEEFLDDLLRLDASEHGKLNEAGA